jgi:peptidyl-prolyl cis-trans isomerase SurA
MGFWGRSLALCLPLLAVALCPVSCGAVVVEKVLAAVNGEIITQTEVQEQSIPFLRRMYQESAARGGLPKAQETERQILEGLIDQKLQLQEAKKQGIAVSALEVDEYIEDLKKNAKIGTEEDFKNALAREGLKLEKLRKDVENHLILLRIVGKEVRSKIILSEQEIRKAYEEQIDKFVEPSQVRLRYLLIPLPPNVNPEAAGQERKKAEAALRRLDRGEDFSAIVKGYSSGPMSEAGGDIGYVKQGELHPGVDKVAFSLKVGQHSEIIPIPSGFVIIKVEEKRTPIKPYAEVAEQLRNQIYEKRAEQRYKEWTQGLRDKAYIEVK